MNDDADLRRFLLTYSVRAKSLSEADAHHGTRLAFVDDVRHDPRTRALFNRWWVETGINEYVATLSTVLDVHALLVDAEGRWALRRNEAALAGLPADQREYVVRIAHRLDDIRADTRDARRAELETFISHVLYAWMPPIISWLGNDLLDAFDAEVLGALWGKPEPRQFAPSPTIGTVPEGRRPTHDGAIVIRNAHWYYRGEVQRPRATDDELAAVHYAEETARAVVPSKKDRDRITERIDTKIVRAGRAEAKRLLELTIPPDQWHRFIVQIFE